MASVRGYLLAELEDVAEMRPAAREKSYSGWRGWVPVHSRSIALVALMLVGASSLVTNEPGFRVEGSVMADITLRARSASDSPPSAAASGCEPRAGGDHQA